MPQLIGRLSEDALVKLWWLGIFLAALFLALVTVVAPVGGLALSLGMGLAAVLLRWPASGTYTIIFFTPLISGMERGVFVPFLRPNELVLLVVGVVLIGRQVLEWAMEGQTEVRLTVIDKAFSLIVVFGILVPLVVQWSRGRGLSIEDVLVLLAPLQYYLIFRLIIGSISTEEEVLKCVRALLVSSAIVAIIAVFQALDLLGVRAFLLQYFPGPQTTQGIVHKRATSVVGNWHALGAFSVFNILVAIAFWVYERPLVREGFLAGIILLNMFSLIATVSASAIGGLLIGLALYGLYTRRLRKAVLLSAFGLPLAILLFWPFVENRIAFQFGSTGGWIPTTLLYRRYLWGEVYWPIIQPNLLLGVSPTLSADLPLSTDNQYLLLLYQGGVLFLFAMLTFLFVAMRAARSMFLSRKGVPRIIGLSTFVILVVISSMNLVGDGLTYSGEAETMWIMLGLMAAATSLRWKRELSAELRG